MKPRRTLLAAVIAALVAPEGPSGRAASAQSPPPRPDAAGASRTTTGFAAIGDVKIYYEVHGAGEPILFMHGGGGSVRTSWPGAYVRALSRDHMVILADSRGHGASSDGPGPITFGRLAHDAVHLLDHLQLRRAHVVGHSAGAIAALHLLVDYPDRVATATLLAGAYHIDNYRPKALADLRRELDALVEGKRIESRLASMPLPVLRKLRSAWLAGPSFSARLLETIDRPTLIVSAGQDVFFAPSVGQEMHARIKGSELINYPDAGHRVQVSNSENLIPAIRDFIARRGRD
jgi:pimeloyl-ACP methyl ester carboxylesterase